MNKDNRVSDELLFTTIQDAYLRGLDWGRKYGSTEAEEIKASSDYADKTTSALSALSLPEQEPVAWRWPHPLYPKDAFQLSSIHPGRVDGVEPLYASPQPKAVTEDMVDRAARALHANSKGKHNHFLPFEDLSAQRILWLREDARAALEAALKEA